MRDTPEPKKGERVPLGHQGREGRSGNWSTVGALIIRIGFWGVMIECV